MTERNNELKESIESVVFCLIQNHFGAENIMPNKIYSDHTNKGNIAVTFSGLSERIKTNDPKEQYKDITDALHKAGFEKIKIFTEKEQYSYNKDSTMPHSKPELAGGIQVIVPNDVDSYKTLEKLLKNSIKQNVESDLRDIHSSMQKINFKMDAAFGDKEKRELLKNILKKLDKESGKDTSWLSK